MGDYYSVAISRFDARHLPDNELSVFRRGSFDAKSSKADQDRRKMQTPPLFEAIEGQVCVLQMDNVAVSSSGILNYTTSIVYSTHACAGVVSTAS